jgi:hypothetical protein
MSLFKKNFIVLFSILFTTAFAQPRKKVTKLATNEDFIHPATSVIFPSLWSGFQREAIYSYDLQNNRIGVNYVQKKNKKSRTSVTFYIHPKRSHDNQFIRDSFTSYDYIFHQMANKGMDIKPSFGSLENDNIKVNYIYSILDRPVPTYDFFSGTDYQDKKSLLSIYECGGWSFRTLVTSDDMTKDQLAELKDKIENYFGVLDIASKKPLPIDHLPEILLSPVVKRDSMMNNATLAAAKAKIEWLGKNLEKKELLTGFNDMNIESEVYAIEKMVEFYKTHEKEWPMHDDTKKYFSEMSRIADHRRIKDHIYYKYEGIINYEEGARRKDGYIQFKIDKDISENTNEIFYKIFYKLE